MPRFFAEVDFTSIPVANFVAEGSATPPTATPRIGFLWNDTSLTDNAVMKYWDGNEWVRMDGGGDIPNGMILDRHVADNAAIKISKIDGLQAALDAVSSDADLAALAGRVDTVEDGLEAEVTARTDEDIAINTRIDGLSTSLTGSYVTIDTAQTVTGDKTFSGNVIVPVGDAPTEAVQLSQLTTLRGDMDTAHTGFDTRLDAVELAVQDVNNATQIELDALAGRVTATEGDIAALEAANTASDSALQAEIDRATAEEIAIRADFAAADTGLGTRITDEAAARVLGDETNATAIADETTRATGAEDALGVRIDGLVSDFGDVDDLIDDAVTIERDRAIAAENLLDGRIDALEGVDNFTQAEFDTFNTANNTALSLKADLVGGKVPLSQLPSVRTDDVYVVDFVGGGFTDETDALASVTDADEGDVAVLNGGPGGAYINTGAGWVPLSSGASGATDAEVQAAVAAEAALRTAADDALRASIEALEAVDYATQAELDAEVATLEGADTALGVRIDDEHAHHQADRTAVEGALATETAARIAGDATNATAVADEAAARAAADTALSDRITTEVADRDAADQQIRADFEAADGVNAAALTAEIDRATAAEETLTTNLATEVTDRTNADLLLQGSIDDVEDALAAEVARSTGIDTDHETRVAALEAAGATAGTDLTTLTNRVTAAEGVNTTQDGRLDALETHDAGEAARIAAAVAIETAAREAADTALTTAVSDEAAARDAADIALGGRIDTEITNRTSADTALGARIDGIETTHTTDMTAVRSEFAAADNVVRGEFAAADALLAADIATRALDADVVHKSGAEDITGVKTFTANPQVPGGTGPTDAVNFDQLDDFVTGAAYDDTALTARVTAVEGEVDVLNGAAGDAGSVATTADDRIAAANGVSIASLVDGKVPATQLPALALTNVSVYADQAAFDAATGMDEGDVGVYVDADGIRRSFIYDGTAWVPLTSPADVTEAELAAAVAAGLAALTAGDGLTRTGNTFNVVGTADRVTVSADAVDIAATYVGQASITTLGTITTGTWNGSTVGIAYGGTGFASDPANTPEEQLDELVEYLGIQVYAPSLYAETLTAMVSGTPFTVTHGLSSQDVIVSLRQVTGAGAGDIVFADVKITDDNTIQVTVDPSHDEAIDLRVTIVGGPVGADGLITGRYSARNPAGRAWS